MEGNIDGLAESYGEDHYGEDDFDYDEFVAREFPEHSDGVPSNGSGPSMASRLVILAVLISLIMTFVFM